MLHVGLPAVDVHRRHVAPVDIARLATLTIVAHVPHPGVHHVASAAVLPAVLQVELLHRRHVNPAIAVDIVVHKVLLVVPHQLGAQVLVQVHVGHNVALPFQVAVAVEVEKHPLLLVGLEVLHVDLAGDALVALLDARGAFADRDAAHPASGHEIKHVGLHGATHHGQTLDEHLHILSAEAQEFDLSGSHRSVAVVDVDRGVVDETLAQVAACRPEELVLTDLAAVDSAGHAFHTLALGPDIDCLERGGAHGVDLLGLSAADRCHQQSCHDILSLHSGSIAPTLP